MATAAAGAPLIFFDMEGTGLLPTDPDIVQIAAVCGSRQYNKYVLPPKPMGLQASQVTGLVVRNDKLYWNGAAVQTVPLMEALQGFIDFIQSCNNGTEPILVGHNVRNYDAILLHRNLKAKGMFGEFAGSISGYLDTLSLAKALLRRTEVGNYRQETLVRRFVPEVTYRAHDALEDARSLQSLHTAILAGRYQVQRHLLKIRHQRISLFHF